MSTSPKVPEPFRLPEQFRLNTSTATDQEIFERVAQLITAYLRSLEFERYQNIHTGSAYDRFLVKNDLPTAPSPGESNTEYAQRLKRELDALHSPVYVKPYERWLRLHPHVAEFGELELKGLKIFLRQGNRPSPTNAEPRTLALALLAMPLGMFLTLRSKKWRAHQTIRASLAAIFSACLFFCCISLLHATPAARAADESQPAHTGNCVTCHRPPEFTDYSFHNTGAAQEEFDAVHGEGSFAALNIPSLKQRQKHALKFLPPTPLHPQAQGVFRLPPAHDNPLAADLGVWSVFANPDFPEPQAKLQKIFCSGTPCDPASILPQTIGRFRTPDLRDLGHSSPYLHNGQKAELQDVLHFYQRMSSLMREGKLRNGDPALASMNLDDDDVTALVAFLQSLDEDYDN
jgi:cytochrome c peroxidase